MENHHFLLENPLFLWPFSIVILKYQKVSCKRLPEGHSTNLYWLLVEPYPSEKDESSSIGMMTFPIYGKINVPVTTNQELMSDSATFEYLSDVETCLSPALI